MRQDKVPVLFDDIDFNPRIPQGMRRERVSYLYDVCGFQSTHSAGNATRLDTGKFGA